MTTIKLEDIPEPLRADYVEREVEGEKVIVNKSSLELESFKSEYENQKSKFDEISSKLSSFEEQKKAEVEAARLEALEKAKADGDTSVFQQQFEDSERRRLEETQSLQEQLQSLKDGIANEKKSAFLSDFVTDISVKGGEQALKALLSSRVKFDDNGNKIYLDADGSATSLDDEGFKKEVQADITLAPLLQSGIVTQGGGNANGSGGSVATNRKFNEYSSSELVDLKNKNPSSYERLKNEFYGT